MSPKESDNKVGLDDLLEDLFGMNIRSFKTIGVLFASPRRYFTAAKTPSWMDKYTPSTRLWLGLMAILIALQFFWASPDAALMSNLANTLNTAFSGAASKAGSSADFANFDMASELQKAMKLNYLIYPFVFVFAFSVFAWLYRAWGGSPLIHRKAEIYICGYCARVGHWSGVNACDPATHDSSVDAVFGYPNHRHIGTLFFYRISRRLWAYGQRRSFWKISRTGDLYLHHANNRAGHILRRIVRI